ncbi:MAG: ribosome biogenesis GTPase YlqF [Bacillota bacterium]
MFIHWFPGHMTKAIRMMTAEMALVESVIYVLDARAPLSSINNRFDEVIGHKPRLYVINKADLVERHEVQKWQKYFEAKGYKCIITNSISKADAPNIVKNLIEINNERIQRYLNKGVKKTIRAMVIGVPNTGKSTLINSLLKEKKAITGNKPGVTRGKQWVAIDKYIDLLDSPGVLYPDFSDQDKATRLALIGSIKEDVLDISELCLEVIDFLKNKYPTALMERYKLSDLEMSNLEIMEEICRKRGSMLRGGEYDYERTARNVITDFRKGYFGKVILEVVGVNT